MVKNADEDGYSIRRLKPAQADSSDGTNGSRIRDVFGAPTDASQVSTGHPNPRRSFRVDIVRSHFSDEFPTGVFEAHRCTRTTDHATEHACKVTLEQKDTSKLPRPDLKTYETTHI